MARSDLAIPPYLALTYEMLYGGFPDGISSTEFPVVVAFLTHYMPIRNLSVVIACIQNGGKYGVDDYTYYSNEARWIMNNYRISDLQVDELVAKFKPFGYDVWLQAN